MSGTRRRPAGRITAALLAVWLAFVAAGTAAAFPDIAGDPNEERILKLKEEGILKGDAQGRFRPGDKLTYAEGITMIVTGLGLDRKSLALVKEPKASDFYDFVPEGRWYTDAFLTAGFHLDLPRSVKPDLSMTRERFAHHLYRGLVSKAGFALPAPTPAMEDLDAVAPEFRGSVQSLIYAGIAETDASGRFEPKRAVTRGEAAGMLYEAIRFLRRLEAADKPVQAADPSPLANLRLESEPLTGEVNAVTVRATVPHAGYGIRVKSVVFDEDKAFIHVEPVRPDPDRVHLPVLTEVSATVYIGSAYTPVLALPK